MKPLGLNEIRSKFLSFFESKGHLVHSSFPLVPQNDKSLLLINSGMAPLKNYFMGVEAPPNKRMTTCQKCIRTGDIDRIGLTARHATFFEMLGNFSFGDYFKVESITWGWEFVTEWMEIPEENVWATIYEEDDEAFDIWKDVVKIPANRIVRLGKDDNFWEIGTGPCGPCSELYYDRGEKYGCGDPNCKPGCECDRFMEFWNHVFTQFDKDDAGVYHRLANPNIDTGMGLERMACLMQGVDSIYEVDTIRHILEAVLEKSGVQYGKNSNTDISIRIITDHIRAVTFMVGDGIMPNNEGRGYVLRRLLRRAARHGKLLGVKGNFLKDLVDQVIAVSGEAYPELNDRQEYIKKIISIEEDRFQQTLDQGLSILMGYIGELEGHSRKVLSGERAFKLYDTYGFPLDLTQEILEEKGMDVDLPSFEAEMEAQRDRARSAREEQGDLGWKEDVLTELSHLKPTEFTGYDVLQGEGVVQAIVGSKGLCDCAQVGDEVRLIMDRTPFYAESGGQVGDKGVIQADGLIAEITDCVKGINGLFQHIAVIKRGTIKVNDHVKLAVDKAYRMDVARNHTATHLLHKALREVLGSHVEQAGSLVTDQRLRFDFTHYQGMSADEKQQIEMIVNEKIFESLAVDKRYMAIAEAKAIGATALFGEKYGETVRVISVGDFSTELCGGTHLDNSSQVALFRLVSESGVAAGVRRIEAVTGRHVYHQLEQAENKLDTLAEVLKTSAQDLVTKVESLQSEVKCLQKENETLKQKSAAGDIDQVIAGAKLIKGVQVIIYKTEGLDMNTLRNLGDRIKDKVSNALIVLANVEEEKVTFIAMATDEAVKTGVHAGNVIREVAKAADGSGGGKPNMAQAGGKDPSKAAEALQKVYELV